jgi:hypothetical protein
MGYLVMEEKILELHRAGFPPSYIAAWTGLPEAEVRRQLAELGLESRYDGCPRLWSLGKLFEKAHRGFLRIRPPTAKAPGGAGATDRRVSIAFRAPGEPRKSEAATRWDDSVADSRWLVRAL